MSTSTRTTTSTRTFVHTATHLAGAITSSLAELLLHVGISVDDVKQVYSYDTAIGEWINERTLGSIEVTFTKPSRIETAGYTFRIDYTAWNPEAQFRDQLARLRRQLAKEPRLPSGTRFSVTAIPGPGHRLSDQSGWSTRTTRLPDHGRGLRHGTAASGPGAAAVLNSHRHS